MALPDPDSSRVVLIGTSRFADPELPDLPAVRNNLDGLAACLRDLGGCTVIADPESPVALVDPIHDAAMAAEDTLLIYYAGHGLVHPRTLGLLLAVVGSAPGRTHTAVAYDQVRECLIDSPARRKIVILDCCYSGRALGGMADPTTAVADEATVEGTYLLASAPANRQALSPPGERFTAFTGALVNVLEKGVPDGPEHLRLDLIYRTVRDTLRHAARPEPQVRTDNTAGDLALVLNPWRPYLPFHGRYQLGKPIEGSGDVLQAYDTVTKHKVLVQQVSSDRIDDRWLRLDHPAIVRTLDIAPDHVVLEYVDGRTVFDTLRSTGPMSPERAAEIAIEVCGGLDYMHEQGLVHGDVGSHSALLTRDGAVKMLTVDLGVPSDPRSDIFATGYLLVEMLTGGPATVHLLTDFLKSPAAAETPPTLVKVVRTAMRPNTATRYQTASAMRADLIRALNQ